MLFGLLSFIFAFCLIIMILLILVQKGKSSLGLGNLGGNNQMLFGSSGGQDFFQKLTWLFGAILIAGSLGLAIWKAKQTGASSALLRNSHSRHVPGPSSAPMPGPTEI